MTDIGGMTDPVAKFNMFSGVLKAGGGDGEPMTLSGVASSTVEDLHGDKILRNGLKDMENQVVGMTIFRNHSYSVPEDVMGTATGGRIVKRGEDKDGNAVWDFDIDMVVNTANPKAIETWEAIKKGTKLGFSIGANIPNGEFEVDRKTGAKTIKRIQLLETSIVGIPANPRSWIARAVEFIDVTNALIPEEVEDAPPADDRDLEDIVLSEDGDEDEICPDCGERHSSEDKCSTPRRRKEDAPADVQDVTEASSPSDAVDSAPDPEVADATDPEAGDTPLESDSVTESFEADDEAELMSYLTESVGDLATVVKEITTARVERAAAKKAQAEAERERDEAYKIVYEALVEVGAAVNQIKNTPLGRKTAFRAGLNRLENIERIYGPDIVKMMENNHNE